LDGCSVTRSVSVDSKIDGLGSVRSKTGWAFAPNWLAYWTSGVAYAHVKYNASISDTETYDATRGGFTNNFVGGASRLGWTLGAGLDWKWPVDAGSAWVFGLEYLHYGFPAHTVSVTDNLGAGTSLDLNSKLSMDTIKAPHQLPLLHPLSLGAQRLRHGAFLMRTHFRAKLLTHDEARRIAVNIAKRCRNC
jgi:opacity protein-like surface antigen